MSVQVPAQSVNGAPHVHWLLTQFRLPPQVAPQKPQLPLLLDRSTQVLPPPLPAPGHCDWFDRHWMTHVPSEHSGAVPGQRVPHAPQLALLC